MFVKYKSYLSRMKSGYHESEIAFNREIMKRKSFLVKLKTQVKTTTEGFCVSFLCNQM